jgi:hypothetical protein
MLSPLTLAFLARYTCPRCEQPLGRFHAYPLLCPSQLISLTSELAPMHLHCAEEHAEDVITARQGEANPTPTPTPTRPRSETFAPKETVSSLPLPLRVIAVVKASPTSPSARLTRLNPEDPATSTLMLFTPEAVHFHHITPAGASAVIIRPATNEEVFHYMEPAIQDAMFTAKPGTDEKRELLHTLGLIQKRWINPPRPSTTESPTEDGQ